MTQLTKADIDGLVEGMVPSQVWPGAVKLDSDHGGWIRPKSALKREMYLAAGLQADGSPKPEKVRAILYELDYPDRIIGRGIWDGRTFIPDGAE